MPGPLRSPSSGKDIDGSTSYETSNSSRWSITSDVSKPAVSVPSPKSLENLREPCDLPGGCDDPPQLPFGRLFFTHLGWGFQFSPGLRSVINDDQPYFIVPRSHCFWQQQIPYVYESSSGIEFDSLTMISLPYADDRFHKFAYHCQRIWSLANPIHMGGCCIYVDTDSWSAAVWEVF